MSRPLIHKVLELLLKHAPVSFDRLESAVARDEGRRSAEAHRFKGAVATVGAGALALAWQELMTPARGDDPAAIEKGDRLIRNHREGPGKEANQYFDTFGP